MNLTSNYASALYEWLSTFAPTFRRPLQEGLFDSDNPKPNEYITYSADAGRFNMDFMQSLSVFSKSTAYTNLMAIVDAIEEAIGEGGTKISKQWGYITIYKGNPFYQDKEDEDSSYRAGYINLIVRICQN